ncbi:MAG: response regulator transcription factor, partial [Chloroflexota bacterium]
MVDKPHILIVEDDLDLSDMVSSYFRVQNYDVDTAAWGEEALKIASEHDLDLIMLDIRLPDIDGFELCRRLRNKRRTQDTPIIFLTEKRDRVDKLQGLELGVVDYITKPFDIQELRLRVRNAINRSQTPATNNPVTDLPEGELV